VSSRPERDAPPDAQESGIPSGPPSSGPSSRTSSRERWKILVDAVEESYEYFLAYAAQGVSGTPESGSGGRIRDFVKRMEVALDGVAEAFEAVVRDGNAEPAAVWRDLIDVLRRDAESARAAVRVVASREAISSELVDNLNANIHLRAVLTDLFLMDEALDPDGSGRYPHSCVDVT